MYNTSITSQPPLALFQPTPLIAIPSPKLPVTNIGNVTFSLPRFFDNYKDPTGDQFRHQLSKIKLSKMACSKGVQENLHLARSIRRQEKAGEAPEIIHQQLHKLNKNSVITSLRCEEGYGERLSHRKHLLPITILRQEHANHDIIKLSVEQESLATERHKIVLQLNSYTDALSAFPANGKRPDLIDFPHTVSDENTASLAAEDSERCKQNLQAVEKLASHYPAPFKTTIGIISKMCEELKDIDDEINTLHNPW